MCAQNSVWGRAEALERLGGDEALLQELCQIFLEESPKVLQKLGAAIRQADAEAVMRAAHSLKGELGYLGAEGAQRVARELEDMGHDKKLEGAAEAFAILEREMTGLCMAIREPTGAAQ